VNDVSGLAHDPAMRETVAALRVPAIVMHMRGTPADMTTRTDYTDVVLEVARELAALLRAARAAGIHHLIADPGIGFAKTPAQSLVLLGATDRLAAAAAAEGAPLLVGPSRKRFLDLVLPPSDPAGPVSVAERRGPATIAAVALAAARGAAVVRVHDVAACVAAVRLADAVRG
jgi:dihydropteroate synthase